MAPPISPAQAPAQEQTLWRGSPSAMLLAGYFALMIVTIVVLPLLARFFASTLPDLDRAAKLVRTTWIVTAILFVIEVLMFLVAWIRLRSTHYIVTNQRVLIEQGIFSKTVDEIDLRYIDDSSFSQGILDRLLGIGNVTLVSSDKTNPRYVLRSINNPRGVRETIRSQAYQISQRQIFTRAT